MYKFVLLLSILIISSCNSQSVDNNIVLINVGEYDKGKIAKLISKVNDLNPKVVSLDIGFSDYDGDQDDKHLSSVLRQCKNLVMPTTIEIIDEERVYFALASRGEFSPVHKKTGFVSAKIQGDQGKIPENFIVWKKDINGDIAYHFSLRSAMCFDSLTAINFMKKNHQTAEYKNHERKFKKFSASDLLNDKVTKEDIEGKIVMMGFLGPGDQDKFTSQSNSSNEPDIYGLEYLANITAQVLEVNSGNK